MNNKYSTILIILIILFYFNIINIELFEKNPILLIFLILNIIIINYNKTIGYILLLFLIFNILNIKKNIKGGGIIDSTAKSIFPMLGVLDGFKNFVDNNKSEKKETFINTNDSSSANSTESESTSTESGSTSTESESTSTESGSTNTEETENIIDENEDPYEDLLDKDEEDELIEGGFDSLLDF